MSQQPPATGKRAALAMDAVRTYRSGQRPDGRQVADLDTILAAMPDWSGLGKDRLPGSLSEVIPEWDGQLTAGAHDGHPVTLAAACPPTSPSASPGPADAAVLPFREPGRPARPVPPLMAKYAPADAGRLLAAADSRATADGRLAGG